MIMLYSPCENKEEAKRISKTLIKENLIACANILESLSLYSWKNKLEESGEAIILAKTTESNEEKARKRISDLHSYEVPCIITIKASNVNPQYLEWAESQCK